MNQNDQMLREALQRAFALGQRYWQQADSDYESEHKKADETYQKYKQLVEDTAQALNHTPDTGNHIADAGNMVRLTDDSLISIYLACKAEWKATNKRQRQRIALIFGNAIMDAMIKKNGGQS